MEEDDAILDFEDEMRMLQNKKALLGEAEDSHLPLLGSRGRKIIRSPELLNPFLQSLEQEVKVCDLKHVPPDALDTLLQDHKGGDDPERLKRITPYTKFESKPEFNRRIFINLH